jgi:hypothetical protein
MKRTSKKLQHPEELNEIYLSYCRGEHRRNIKNRFKISDAQFVRVIFNKIKEANKKMALDLLVKEKAGDKKSGNNREFTAPKSILKFIATKFPE